MKIWLFAPLCATMKLLPSYANEMVYGQVRADTVVVVTSVETVYGDDSNIIRMTFVSWLVINTLSCAGVIATPTTLVNVAEVPSPSIEPEVAIPARVVTALLPTRETLLMRLLPESATIANVLSLDMLTEPGLLNRALVPTASSAKAPVVTAPAMIVYVADDEQHGSFFM